MIDNNKKRNIKNYVFSPSIFPFLFFSKKRKNKKEKKNKKQKFENCKIIREINGKIRENIPILFPFFRSSYFSIFFFSLLSFLVIVLFLWIEFVFLSSSFFTLKFVFFYVVLFLICPKIQVKLSQKEHCCKIWKFQKRDKSMK